MFAHPFCLLALHLVEHPVDYGLEQVLRMLRKHLSVLWSVVSTSFGHINILARPLILVFEAVNAAAFWT